MIPRQAERIYRAKLLAYARTITSIIKEFVQGPLESIVVQRDEELGYNKDSFSTNLETQVDLMKLRIGIEAAGLERLLPSLFEQVQKFNKNQLSSVSRSRFTVDVFNNNLPLQALLDSWSQENASLIKSMGEDSIRKVSEIAQRSLRAGRSIKQIADEIERTTGALPSKAKLIARDQTSKLNSALTQSRQRSVGISFYEWDTSDDERVRHSHDVLEGALCRWDDPSVYSTDDGRTWKSRAALGATISHPGEDIQCRCTAYPVFNDEVVQDVQA